MSQPEVQGDSPAHFFRPQSRLGRIVEVCESGLFVFFGTVFGIGFASLPLFMFTDFSPREAWAPYVNVAALAACLTLDVPMLVRSWRAIWRGRHPVAVTAAAEQWRAPLLLRPLIAGWWLIHFALGVIMVLGFEAAAPGQPEPFISYFMLFTLMLSTNGFALHALATMGVGKPTLHRLWHWRIVLDVVIALAAWNWQTTLVRIMK